ncbi:MAG: hypothetical protein ABJZ55_16060 [Fuerstiella sp.]
MTIQQAMKEHLQKSARELWEANKGFQKIPFPEFATAWHNARMAMFKPKKHNSTGHENIDAGEIPDAKVKASPTKQ